MIYTSSEAIKYNKLTGVDVNILYSYVRIGTYFFFFFNNLRTRHKT